ncbi:MAG: GWxTD domain-containing protein, partial [Balneolales bacterium]
VTVYDEVLSSADIHSGLSLNPDRSQNGPVQISITNDNTPYTYALKQIPNSKFENANYRMEIWQINEAEEKKMIGNRRFLNRWIDIPTSLLNVDVAINMMRFIVNDETLSTLKDGNERERERKFREFWGARNPTPETEYNELMVEYFERIDYAFENYTTPGNPGYESDMGKVYIQNGKPINITRRFPSNQPAVEIWEYNSRRFRFEATSGFGDYQLRETR